jgi:hypothetical protein
LNEENIVPVSMEGYSEPKREVAAKNSSLVYFIGEKNGTFSEMQKYR